MKEILYTSDFETDDSAIMFRWLKKAGDTVMRNEPICEVTTDKAVTEISSPADGVLSKILKDTNQKLVSGEILGYIGATSHVSKNIPLVDQIEVTNTQSPRREVLGVRRRQQEKTSAPIVNGTSTTQSHRIPHTPMRKVIAERVTTSLLHKTPHVTAVFEVSLRALLELRRSIKLEHTQAPTLTAFFIKAASYALAEAPELNSRWHDDTLEIFHEHNIGVVMDLHGNGLQIPVIRAVEERSLQDIASELQRLHELTLNGSLTASATQHGTFTISNYGVHGGLFATPVIINQPQTAILGIGSLQEKLKLSNQARGEKKPLEKQDLHELISSDTIAYVSLTIDHRALDSFHVNKFMKTFSAFIEHPTRLL